MNTLSDGSPFGSGCNGTFLPLKMSFCGCEDSPKQQPTTTHKKKMDRKRQRQARKKQHAR